MRLREGLQCSSAVMSLYPALSTGSGWEMGLQDSQTHQLSFVPATETKQLLCTFIACTESGFVSCCSFISCAVRVSSVNVMPLHLPSDLIGSDLLFAKARGCWICCEQRHSQSTSTPGPVEFSLLFDLALAHVPLACFEDL